MRHYLFKAPFFGSSLQLQIKLFDEKRGRGASIQGVRVKGKRGLKLDASGVG